MPNRDVRATSAPSLTNGVYGPDFASTLSGTGWRIISPRSSQIEIPSPILDGYRKKSPQDVPRSIYRLFLLEVTGDYWYAAPSLVYRRAIFCFSPHRTCSSSFNPIGLAQKIARR